jgi:hypothetical protein
MDEAVERARDLLMLEVTIRGERDASGGALHGHGTESAIAGWAILEIAGGYMLASNAATSTGAEVPFPARSHLAEMLASIDASAWCERHGVPLHLAGHPGGGIDYSRFPPEGERGRDEPVADAMRRLAGTALEQLAAYRRDVLGRRSTADGRVELERDRDRLRRAACDQYSVSERWLRWVMMHDPSHEPVVAAAGGKIIAWSTFLIAVADPASVADLGIVGEDALEEELGAGGVGDWLVRTAA